MKIAITGAAGYIGSRVMKEAIKNNMKVIGIDNFSNGQINEINDNKIKNIDIENLEKLENEIKNCDAVLHLAAISGVQDCEENKNKAYKTNIVGTENISFLCYKYNIPLLFVSSMATLGNPTDFPITENHPKNPVNFYGLTKLAGMKNVETFSKNNFPSYTFILGNVYGNHKIDNKKITKQTVVNIFINQAKKGKPLTVFKPGTQARDFVHVKDVARIFIEATKKLIKDKKQNQKFNLASNKSYSVLDIANMIKKYNSKETKIQIQENPRNETLVQNFNVDISKLKDELDLGPKINLKEKIKSELNE